MGAAKQAPHSDRSSHEAKLGRAADWLRHLTFFILHYSLTILSSRVRTANEGRTTEGYRTVWENGGRKEVLMKNGK